MPSKILHQQSAAAAEPMEWRELRGARESKPAAGRVTRPGNAAGEQSANAELESRLKQEVARAREEGTRQGEAAGRQKGLAEVDAMLRKLAHTVEEVAGLKARLRHEAERDVVWLAMAVARRVLRREIRVDEEAVLGLVKAALDNASLRDVTEVRVHPGHKAKMQEFIAGIGAPVAITVRGDATLEPGGVVLETSRGTLDASMETQLDEIGRGLADVLPGAGRRG